jgi:HAMP domain-containing protein
MNLRIFVMIALVALVAGAAALVYAQHDTEVPPDPTAATVSEAAAAGEVTGTAPTPIEATGAAPKVLYDLDALPDPVKRMLEEIIVAAESGDIENMRPVLESNELKPVVTTAQFDDPLAFWKKASGDGTGRDVLAAMLNVLSSGFVRMGQGKDEMYVWPYFAETDLAKLTASQEVELYRIVPPSLALPMKKGGKYSYYRLGISPGGVWHYFLQ